VPADAGHYIDWLATAREPSIHALDVGRDEPGVHGEIVVDARSREAALELVREDVL
jgi:hypothetical protein